MTEKQYKLERWTDTSLYYSFPTGSVHQGIGYVIEKVEKDLNQLAEENERLKNEIHLVHMRAMFSTVKSFKGDISKRYMYDEETDTIYDTANKYGQYNKILDKKEIVMLLNEYETILKVMWND